MPDDLINIRRVHVALHGVATSLAEAAQHGLDAEIARRLYLMRSLPGGAVGPGCFDSGRFDPDPITVDPDIDPATLRGLIAERLCEAVWRQRQAHREAGEGRP